MLLDVSFALSQALTFSTSPKHSGMAGFSPITESIVLENGDQNFHTEVD